MAYKKSKKYVKNKGYKIVDSGKKTARQAHKEFMATQKTERYKANVSEAQKTARSKSRAAAVASIVSSSVGQAEATKREQARLNSQMIVNQYAALIDGNRNQPNAALPEDTTGSSDKQAIPLN